MVVIYSISLTLKDSAKALSFNVLTLSIVQVRHRDLALQSGNTKLTGFQSIGAVRKPHHGRQFRGPQPGRCGLQPHRNLWNKCSLVP